MPPSPRSLLWPTMEMPKKLYFSTGSNATLRWEQGCYANSEPLIGKSGKGRELTFPELEPGTVLSMLE